MLINGSLGNPKGDEPRFMLPLILKELLTYFGKLFDCTLSY